MNTFFDEDNVDENIENTPEDEEEDPYVNIRAGLTVGVKPQVMFDSNVLNPPPHEISTYEKTQKQVEDIIKPNLISENVGKYLLFRDDDGSRQIDEYIVFKIIIESNMKDKKIYPETNESKVKKIKPTLRKGSDIISLSSPMLVFLVKDPDPNLFINERNERLTSRNEKNKIKRNERNERKISRLYKPYGYGGKQTKKKYIISTKIKNTNISKKSKKSKKNKKSKSKKI
jgi:hypothetical protein